MKTLALFILLCFPIAMFCQSEEKLYCADCGKQNKLTSRYCYDCGKLLDKSAIVQRLSARIATADSAQQPIRMSAGELSVLIETRAEQRVIEELYTRGIVARTRATTSTEAALDIIAPIATVVAALFLISKALF